MLNHAITSLCDVTGVAREDYVTEIVPLYQRLLEELRVVLPQEVAEQRLVDLLTATHEACRRRWSVRLPLRRPDSDYRRLERPYTEALITAMAVDTLHQILNEDPIALGKSLIPAPLWARLQSNVAVKDDWLGFFAENDRGGLRAIACNTFTEQTCPAREFGHPKKSPPLGSGSAMLEAVKAALAAQEIGCNQESDFVHVDANGRTFLEHPQVLQWCNEKLGLDESEKRLKNRFGRLRILHRNRKGHQLFFGRCSPGSRRRVGFVIEAQEALWSEDPPRGAFRLEI